MFQQLKPTDAAIEQLAMAETDPAQLSRFAPVRWGFLGNLLIIAAAGSAGFVHALVASLWRRIFSLGPDGKH